MNELFGIKRLRMKLLNFLVPEMQRKEQIGDFIFNKFGSLKIEFKFFCEKSPFCFNSFILSLK